LSAKHTIHQSAKIVKYLIFKIFVNGLLLYKRMFLPGSFYTEIKKLCRKTQFL